VDHSVRADESLFPGPWAEEAIFDQEEHRLDQQLVELLDGDLEMLFLVDEGGFAVGGILAKSGEPVTESSFGGEDAMLKAEEPGVLGVVRFVKVAQGLGPGPLVGNLPAGEEEDRDRIEGGPAPGEVQPRS